MDEITTIKNAEVFRVDYVGSKFNPDGPERFLLKIDKAQMEELKEKGYTGIRSRKIKPEFVVDGEDEIYLLFVHMPKNETSGFDRYWILHNVKIKPYHITYNSTEYQNAIFVSVDDYDIGGLFLRTFV